MLVFDPAIRRFVIGTHAPGKVLDVAGAGMRAADVLQWPSTGGKNQRWVLDPCGNGEFRIVADHSGRVLDVHMGNLNPGTKVWTWEWNGGPAQRWVLTEFDDKGNGRIALAANPKLFLDVRNASQAHPAAIQLWTRVDAPWQVFHIVGV